MTELIGLGYLVWLWFATGLNHSDRRKQFLDDGRLPQMLEAETP